MLDYLVTTMVEVTLSTSVIIALLLLLRPIMGKKYAAKWRYWLWLALAFRLLIPLNVTLPETPIQIDPPAITPNSTVVMSEQVILSSPDATALHQSNEIPAKQSVSQLKIAAIVWVSGIAVVLAYQLIGHFLFLRTVRRWSKPISDQRIFERYRQTLEQMGIKKRIAIKTSKAVNSPMLTGLARPTVWLPTETFSDEELQVIFKHELIHYQQRHLWFKLIMLCTRAVHWFNPLVYLMVKEANKEVEIVCDSEVVKGTDMTFRKRYSEFILSMMNRHPSGKAVLFTHFNGGKKMMKQRLTGIFDTRKKGRGIGAILLVGLILSLAGGLVACGTEATESGATPVQSTDNSPSSTDNTAVPKQSTEGSADGQQKPEPSNGETSSDKNNFLDSQEGKVFEGAAQKFTKAYLSGDSAAMKEQLLDPESPEHHYLKENLLDDVESMTLKLGAENSKENSISAQYEIRLKGKDTYQYVDLQMEKVNQEWKVRSYGLEQ